MPSKQPAAPYGVPEVCLACELQRWSDSGPDVPPGAGRDSNEGKALPVDYAITVRTAASFAEASAQIRDALKPKLPHYV